MNIKSRFLYELLSNIDLFRVPVTLLLKRQERYSTYLGQFFSLCVIAMTMLALVFLVQDMYSLQQPNIVAKTIANQNPEVDIIMDDQAFVIDQDHFLFAVAMADSKASPLMNSEEKVYYTVMFQFCQLRYGQKDGVIVSKTECIDVGSQPCSTIDVDPKLVQGISIESKSVAQCVNQTSWSEKMEIAKLQGVYTSISWDFVTIEVFRCDPNIQSNCATKEEQEFTLDKGFGSILFSDRLLDQGQPGDPFTIVSKRQQVKSPAWLKYTLRHTFFENILNFFYFFPSVESFHVLKLSSEMESTLQPSNVIMRVTFQLDDKSDYYQRTYTTFLEIMANVGGLFQFLTLVVGLLIGPLTRVSSQLKIINQIFEIDEGQHQSDSGKGTLISQIQRDQKLGSSSIQKPKESPMRNSQQDLKCLLNQKSVRKLRMNWYHILVSRFINRRKKILNTGIQHLQQELEIGSILNKLIELEHLKNLLLDQNQVRLLKFISRPVLYGAGYQSVVPSSDKTQNRIINEDMQGQIQQAFEAYRRVRESTNVTDTRLLELINPNFKELFEADLVPVGKASIASPKAQQLIDEYNGLIPPEVQSMISLKQIES